jgi:hypothetical protein
MFGSETLGSQSRSQQTIEKDKEHDRREEHVQSVALDGKANNRESYPENRSRYQEYQSELYQSSAAPIPHTLNHAGDGPIIGRLAAKHMVVRRLVRVPKQVDAAATKNHCGGDEHSGAEQVPENPFQTPISPRLGRELMSVPHRRGSNCH